MIRTKNFGLFAAVLIIISLFFSCKNAGTGNTDSTKSVTDSKNTAVSGNETAAPQNNKIKTVLGEHYTIFSDKEILNKYILKTDAAEYWFEYDSVNNSLFLSAASEGIGGAGDFKIEDVKKIDTKYIFTATDQFTDDEKSKTVKIQITFTFTDTKTISVSFDNKKYSKMTGNYKKN